MTISARNLRSAQGGVRVALGQIQGIFSGVCKDTPEARQEALDMLMKAADLLQEEAKLAESKMSPVLVEYGSKGEVLFEGSVPFVLPEVAPASETASPLADLPTVTKEGVEALANMVK